mgnify:CR=1 FL=1
METSEKGPADVLRWERVAQPAEELVQALRQGLTAYNVEHGRIQATRPAGIFVREADGTLAAGIYGEIWGSCLDIKYLWVHTAWRGRGIGTRLLRGMEEEGRRQGCVWAYLNTFSFQAPDFYRRHGYEPIFTMEGYPDGITRIFLRKRLT